MTVFRDAMHSYNTHVEELSEEQEAKSARDSLYRVLARQYEFYQKRPEESVFVLRYVVFPPAFLQETIEKAFLLSDEMLTKIIEGLIVQGMEDGSVRDQPVQPLVDSFLNVMDGLSMQYFYYSSREIYERKLNNAFETYWNGVRS